MDVSLRSDPSQKIQYFPSLQHKKELLRKHRSNPYGSTLFSRGKRTKSFFTSDSKRYVSAYERDLFARGFKRYESVGKFDSVHMCFAHPKTSASEALYEHLQEKYSGIRNSIANLPEFLSSQVSLVKVWNASIVGAIFFGMFSMTLIYRYLGQQVSADSVAIVHTPVAANEMVVAQPSAPVVLGVSTEAADAKGAGANNASAQLDAKDIAFATKANAMVKGYPIEAMMPYILKQDKEVAAFLISIAKKESNWGKRVPVLDGKDCFNYWGYRGIRKRMGTGGHTCFDNPQDAVETVAKRIKQLVTEQKLDTPQKMIIWKCGSSCAGHSKESVLKWISDVDGYWRALK